MKCDKCGGYIEFGLRNCPNCGNDIIEHQKSGSSGLLVIISFVALLIVVISFVVVPSFEKKDNIKDEESCCISSGGVFKNGICSVEIDWDGKNCIYN